MKTKNKIWAGPLIQRIFKIGQNIKGKNMRQARALYPDLVFRATIVNGKLEYDPNEILSNRINVEVRNDKIVRIVDIG